MQWWALNWGVGIQKWDRGGTEVGFDSLQAEVEFDDSLEQGVGMQRWGSTALSLELGACMHHRGSTALNWVLVCRSGVQLP
jgi:hypothetical protein